MATPHEELGLLSILHYVVAAIAAVFSLFPVVHLVVGIGVLSGAFPEDGASTRAADGPPLQWMGWLFVAIALFLIVGGLTAAGLTAFAGRSLALHRRHTFCLVMAAVNCMFLPFGTVLGVFTIIALQKPEVKRLFGLPATEWSAPPGPSPGGPATAPPRSGP